MSLLEARGIKKTYRTRFGGASVEALKNVNFTVEKGEYVAIMGESGSGKTTLLNIIAALDKPTEGTVILDGMKLSAVRDSDLAKFRRDNLGYVFQDFLNEEGAAYTKQVYCCANRSAKFWRMSLRAHLIQSHRTSCLIFSLR